MPTWQWSGRSTPVMLPAAALVNSQGEKLPASRTVLGWGGGWPSCQAKPLVLSPAVGRSAAAMGGRRSRLPVLRMTQRWMKSCAAVDGRGLQDVPSCRSPSALLSDGAHVLPGERAPCVSADAFEDSLWGDRSRLDPPPFLRWGAVPEPCRQGGGCGVTCQGRRPFPGPPSSLPPAKTQIELSVPPAVPPSPNTNHSPRRRG